LRAVSIALVVWSHARGTRGFPARDVFAWVPCGDVGNLGVRVFFVISGYLITSLLIEEIRATGHVDLKAFYVRRVFRIFPAFYAYLAVIVALGLVGAIPLTARDALLAATYTVNYEPVRAWHVGHIWSLSVEEQFYLLWPAILSAVGLRKGLFAAGFALVAAPVARMAFWYLLPDRHGMIGEAFPTIADAIAIGCFLSAARPWLDERPRYLGFLRSPLFVLVPLAGLAINGQAAHARLFFAAGETLLDLCIALVVDRCIRCPDGLVGRALESRPFVFVGTLSYSLYLWQQPFLNHHSADFVATFPQNVVGLVLAALGSHYLVEKPFLRLRHRIGRPAPHAVEATPAPRGA
jgi:peptidoglycan/LPS O-acetylase OafA/YrhL